jgi:hypothetical protein
MRLDPLLDDRYQAAASDRLDRDLPLGALAQGVLTQVALQSASGSRAFGPQDIS